MKRYQCIKNWYYLSDDSDDSLLFKIGTCYPETNEEPYLPGNVVLRCEDGNGIQVTPDVIKTYFQELLDLNVDDVPADFTDYHVSDEQYSNPMEHEYVPHGCSRAGVAICIAVGLSVVALILFS